MASLSSAKKFVFGNSLPGSKLFVAVDAAPHVDPAIYDVVTLGDWKQEHLHLTLQYCGKEIDCMDERLIQFNWLQEMGRGLSKEDFEVTILPEFALFGKENNMLVVKCQVTEPFKDVVNAARETCLKKCARIPPSDFPFSPHITLGESHVLPTNVKEDNFGKFSIDRINFYGDDNAVRTFFDTTEVIGKTF